MAAFDAELRASIRELQSAVTALSAENAKANASLRQMQAEVKGVAQGHREAAGAAAQHAGVTDSLAKQVGQVGNAAKLTAGESGGMVGQLARLVSINPLAIAAGLGIGFIVTKIHEVIAGAQDAQKALEALMKAPDELARKLAGSKRSALLAQDDNALIGAEFDKALPNEGLEDLDGPTRERARSAAARAVRLGRAKSEDEALGRLRKSGALRPRASGFGDAVGVSDGSLLAIAAGSDSADFADAARRVEGSAGYDLAQEGRLAKTAAAVQARERAQNTATGNGGRTDALLTEMLNIMRKRDTAIDNGQRGYAKALEQQLQERIASFEIDQSQSASDTK